MRIKHAMLASALAAVASWATSASAFEFHGYLRTAGIGWNSANGGQVCFQNSGNWSKFRLGNECENYGELEFDETLYKDKSGVEFKGTWMLAYSIADGTDWEATSPAFRQNWIGAKLPQLGNATIWVGKRYYFREDVHMIDFYYAGRQGPGAGIEDVDLGFGKFAFAIFQYGGLGTGSTQTYSPDFRFYGIQTNPNGSLMVDLSLALVSSVDDNTSMGVSPYATVEHLQTNVLGGFNKLAVQYGAGNWSDMNMEASSNTHNSDYWSIRALDHLQIQPVPQFSAEAVAMYWHYNQPADSGYDQMQIGVRPVYHVNDYFKLQGEVGFSYYKGQADGSEARNLVKATIAPTLVAGGNFWARPELRAFLTYATWNDAAKTAGIASKQFGSDSSGATAGLQVEAWW